MTTPRDRELPVRFACEIPSRLENVDAVCDRVCEVLIECALEKHNFVVELLLREFLTNAVIHGNRADSEKVVSLEVLIEQDWITLRIADQGPGFSWREQSGLPPDDQKTSGRGMAIGALYAHDMQFNTAGNEVTLRVSTITRKETP